MIESMTGFGSGEYAEFGLRATAEIRSVNSRFIEISVKLPRQFSAFELEARELVRKELQRGKITAAVQLERENGADVPIKINPNAVKAYMAMLSELRAVSGIEEPIRLEHLLKFSEIFEVADEESAELEREWKVISQALKQAIASLRDMRRNEGKQLALDFKARIAAINQALDEIEAISRQTLAATKEKLRQKARELIGDESIAKERLEMEIVLLADKMDITEECVRFRSHNKFFLEALDSGEPAGRKLNFLLQEQSREANTIASKSQNAEISQKTVFIKEELEKIREQVQNIE
ncbi:MAG: YicC family protein [Chloroherpetonaceae bacterium]|nr:YicC family protein [Chloroherpetonaceae bacterium]MDW8438640.1 YicC/YloC family endoribonuclease [Chloroherpetonaceae bacterium]